MGRIVESRDVQFEKTEMLPDILENPKPFRDHITEYLESQGLEYELLPKKDRVHIAISGFPVPLDEARAGLEERLSVVPDVSIVYAGKLVVPAYDPYDHGPDHEYHSYTVTKPGETSYVLAFWYS